MYTRYIPVLQPSLDLPLPLPPSINRFFISFHQQGHPHNHRAHLARTTVQRCNDRLLARLMNRGTKSERRTRLRSRRQAGRPTTESTVLHSPHTNAHEARFTISLTVSVA